MGRRRLGLNLLAVAGGLVAALILLEILLRFLGPGHLYRTPDDMLASFDYRRGHGIYKPNRHGEMLIPYGDLVAMEGRTRAAIAEPRLARYHTDSLGFRNDAEYAGEAVLLVGDSIVAGSGSTQADILSDQMKENHGIAAYNLAFPGELHSYVRYVQGFFKTHQSGPKAYIFLFEGNDFPLLRSGGGTTPAQIDAPPSPLEISRKETVQSLREFLVYRYAFSFYHIFGQRFRPGAPPRVTVMKIKGRDDLSLGFLNAYVAVAQRASYDAGDDFAVKLNRIKDHLGVIFFVPTKFRVYYNFVQGAPAAPLPDAQWEYVRAAAARVGVTCIDLTGPLREESGRLLPEGKLTYWKDDTHWNRNGIAVAARELKKLLAGQ
jgi:hypothetical protein